MVDNGVAGTDGKGREKACIRLYRPLTPSPLSHHPRSPVGKEPFLEGSKGFDLRRAFPDFDFQVGAKRWREREEGPWMG